MERNRGFKILSIIALLIGVVGLTLGFAAFTSTLTIRSSAEIKPAGNTFNVDFSSAANEVVANDITPTKNPETLEAKDAEIDNTAEPTISNLGATFTAPGQSVTYEFYAYNAGEYPAYLNSITYSNVTDSSSSKVCTPKTGTTVEYVASACNDIVVSVQVGTEAAVTGSKSGISNHTLAKNTGELVTVTITYEKKENQTLADGDFTVEFGDITLDYSSVD